MSHSSSPDANLPATLRAQCLADTRCIVVKVGTRVLTTPDGKLNRQRIDELSAGLCEIADSDRQTIMVSSGAVGAGMGKLGLDQRPQGIAQLQAVAAVGQTELIQAYEKSLFQRGRHAAQVLLTAADLRRRSGYLHVRNALTQIHAFNSIAIVNENDCVAVSELMTTFGDNDRLAAQVAGLLSDTMLIILSDIDGLFDGHPSDPGSKKLDVVEVIDEKILAMAQSHNSSTSKGGMASKLQAASMAVSHGHPAIIAPGNDPQVLQKILAGDPIGTLFLPEKEHSIRGRKRWIGSSAHATGTLTLDAGAVKALLHKGSSLLAIGITSVSGSFSRGGVVAIHDPHGKEIAKGLCNYPSSEVEKILGRPSDQISEILGHCSYECVIHRDNLVTT
ncbi:glutamate 5-kinase [Rubripirellula amarantea]|nr:glutamate 5-kinase [Rubripirellula amarantea]